MRKKVKVFVIGSNYDLINDFKEKMNKNGYQVVSYKDIKLYKFEKYNEEEKILRKTLFGITTCDGVTSVEDTVLTSKIIKVCNILGIPYLSVHNWIAYLNNRSK
jgi:hypothetical protein